MGHSNNTYTRNRPNENKVGSGGFLSLLSSPVSSPSLFPVSLSAKAYPFLELGFDHAEAHADDEKQRPRYCVSEGDEDDAHDETGIDG